MRWTNERALHRHSHHAWDDFAALREREGGDDPLWHSLAHHLRHVLHRSGLNVEGSERFVVEKNGRKLAERAHANR